MKLSGTNVTVFGDVTSYGPLDVDADRDIRLRRNISSAGKMTMDAGRDIELNEDSKGKTTSGGEMTLIAGKTNRWGDVEAWGKLETTNAANMTVKAADNIGLYHTATSADAAGELKLIANTGGHSHDGHGDMTAYGDLTSVNGGISIYSSDSTTNLYGNVTAGGGNLTLHNNTVVKAANKTLKSTNNNVILAKDKTLDSDNDLTIEAGNNIHLGKDLSGGGEHSGGNVTTQGDLTLRAGNDIRARGTLTSVGGEIELFSSDSTTYLWGDVTAYDNIWFGSNVEFEGWDDQTVWAQNGSITADGYLNKLNSRKKSWSDGSLYLHADGDISLADYVTAAICYPGECFGGGVSIISDNGSIFTPGAGGMLNVPITGRSNHFEGVGVELPEKDPENPKNRGLAAIVIMSNENLNFGPDSELIACGTYDSTVFDDRPYVNFLDMAGESIGGHVRDEGLPIDVAVYLASTGTDTLAGQGNIHLEGQTIDVATGGTMVVDAYDAITFGDFSSSILNIDRMELVSRITEWLQDAVGRLPFAGDAGGEAAFEALMGGELIYRGAGLENGSIIDGRAWVLERLEIPPAPLVGMLLLGTEEIDFGEGGCPALMTWLADELGVDEEGLQVYLANAFVYSTDCQPCILAAKLRDLALILDDPEGVGVAALAQVISEFITTPAPPSEEEMALIAEQLASHIGDDTYYAAAEQWIDALVAYVGILTDEMGWPADKAITFVMENYGSPVTESDNAALVAYVQARLEASGGGGVL